MAANFSPSIATGPARRDAVKAEDSHFGTGTPVGRAALITLSSLVAGLTFAYWRVLADTAEVWSQPQYSHGWIVPLIGLYLMWSRRPDQSEQSHPYQLDLGVIRLDLVLVAVVALTGGVAIAGVKLGLPWLTGLGVSLLCGASVGWVLLRQPFSALGEDWRFDFEDYSERFLSGGSSVASLMVAVVYTGFVPNKFQLPLMLLAIIIYGAVLVAVSLASREGPLLRTGSETIAATLAIVGTSLVWIQASELDAMPLMRLCFIVSLLGAFSLIGGNRLLRWAGPAVAFVVFMYPLPSLVEHRLLPLLQKVAAVASTTVLQVMGLPVYRVGSHIEGLDLPLEVAEACSGLRMSTIFGAMTVAMVFLIQRPWWDKFIILLSAIPVALLVNMMRIIATALLYHQFSEHKGIQVFVHDWAGISMMPVAMGILWLELKVLSSLSVEEEGLDYQSTGGSGMPRI